MRAFIVLCVVAFASADHLGYNYHPVDQSYTPGGVGSASSTGPSFAGIGSTSSSGPLFGGVGSTSSSGPSFGGVGSGSSFGGIGSASHAGPSFGNAGVAVGPSHSGLGSSLLFGGSAAGPTFGGNNAGPSLGGFQGGLGASSSDHAVIAPQVELEKEFYTFTADEQDFNEPAASHQVASSVKKGLRVIFIKGPENKGLENAALSLAKHAAEQHTAIYVLNKQTDLSDLANKLNVVNENVNNKPEVHFVKYRTPEDAVNAQKAIQGEYDALGGKSQHIDGGVAQVLNFASQAPAAGHHGAATEQVPFGSHGSFAPQGSFGQGSLSQKVSVGPHGFSSQQGSFGVGSGPTGSAVGGISSTYLPPTIFSFKA